MGSTNTSIEEIMRRTEDAYASVTKTMNELNEITTDKKEPVRSEEENYKFQKANEVYINFKNEVRDCQWDNCIPFVQKITKDAKVEKYWTIETPYGYIGCAMFDKNVDCTSLEEMTTVYWEDYFYETVYQLYVGWLYNDASETDGYFLGTFESKRILFVIFDSSDIKKRHDVKNKMLCYLTMLAYYCISYTMYILIQTNGTNKCFDYIKNILDNVSETGCILNYKAGKYFRIK